MISRRTLTAIVVPAILFLVLSGLVASLGTLNSPRNPEQGKSVVEYANSKQLPSEIIDQFKKLNTSLFFENPPGVSEIPFSYYNAIAVVDEIVSLGNYSSSPMVQHIVSNIVSDGRVRPGEALWTIKDVDEDGITNFLEITKYKTDPTSAYTSGTNLDDFNAIFTYGVDPNNQTATKEILDKVPNVNVLEWHFENGTMPGGTTYDDRAIVILSMRDPLIQYYANRAEIRWGEASSNPNRQGIVVGNLYVDGTHIFLKYNGTRSTSQPSLYFTQGREAVCAGSAFVDVTVLKLMGYPSVRISGYIYTDGGCASHAWGETLIDGEIYVFDFNEIIPRDKYYSGMNFTAHIDGSGSYNPDWYK